LWECVVVSDDATVEELKELVLSLRREIDRLKEELARVRRDRDERPPHYL
jgi:uncharacterized small protein (DUF1192 family)